MPGTQGYEPKILLHRITPFRAISRALLFLGALALGWLLAVGPAQAATFVVNSNLDDAAVGSTNDGICDSAPGAPVVCTLRAAIQEANGVAGPDIIGFSIGSGPVTIVPGSSLPIISERVTIDGTTQPGFAGTPIVEVDGTSASPPGVLNLNIGSSGSTIRGLVINRASLNVSAIRVISSSDNVIAGNFLGTDVTGTLALGNNVGVRIGGGSSAADNNRVGGTAAADRNIISGNADDGIQIEGGTGTASNNVIQGNYIGLDATGTVVLGNSSQGISIRSGAANNTVGGTAIGAGNVISGNSNAGIQILNTGTTGNRIEGNFIGTDVAGTTPLGNPVGVFLQASNNRIGGTTGAERNIISGNTVDGIQIVGTSTTGNLVEGNYIGLDVTGTAAMGNTNQGVVIFNGASGNVIGGTAPGARNVISANGNDGVLLGGVGTTGNRVEGNFIGTDATGMAALGNLRGVELDASGSGNFIGGTTPGASNRIAYNWSNGVQLTPGAGTGNLISSNELYSNGGFGIEVGPGGVNPNDAGDADTGPNDLQNYPVLSAAMTNGAGTAQIAGSFQSAPSTIYRIEFFASAAADLSSYGEGERYLGFTNVTTDAMGNAVVGASLTTSLAAGEFVTATATDPSSNTSEFSAAVTAVDSLAVTTTADVVDGATTSVTALIANPGADGRISLREAIQAANATAGTDTVRFAIPLSDPNHVYYRDDSIPGSLSLVVPTSLPDADIIDFDPDYPAGLARSWYRIQPTSSLTVITGATVLDATTQPGFIAGGPVVELSGAVAGNADGLALVGAPGSTIRGFVINRFVFSGIGILTNGNLIEVNFIGTDVAGTGSLGNGWGIALNGASNNTIGGTGANSGNRIAYNNDYGIAIAGTATGNSILANSIFSNVNLGIDLVPNGVTANDAGDVDGGPNDLLNFPVITSALGFGGTVTVSFTLDVPAGSYRIEFFKNPSGADPSGNGEGESFASSINVTHSGGGPVSFDHSFLGAIGDVITATTTNCTDGAACTVFGNTSEFSNAVTAAGAVTISSAVNQSSTVGGSSTPMAMIDILDAGGAITALNDIRIRIPLAFPMRWDPAATTATLGGPAATKVATQVKGFEDAGHTLVLNVTSNFATGDRLTVSGLKFFSFTAPAAAANLELETENGGLATAFDDKTIEILPGLLPTLSSDDDQAFVTGQPPVLMVPLTVSEGTTASIVASKDIRVRIPSSFNMTWEPGVTSAWILGPAAGKVSSTVSFVGSDRTLVIDVLTPFVTGDFITVSGLYFKPLLAPSASSNLELEVDDAGTVIDLDDKTIRVDLATDVPVFTATATDLQVKLEWVFPAGTCDFVRIVRDTAGFPGALDPELITDVPCGGLAGTKGSLVDSPLSNGTTYFYSAYVDHGSGYTAGKFVKARPFDTPVTVHWAYSTGAASMAPPGLRFQPPDSFVYAVSNDSILHSMRGGASGGDWPGPWKPYKLGGPAQARPPVVSFSVGGGNGAAFLGSQDGRAYAVDVVNGSLKWDEPLASMLQAAPAGHFQYYNPAAFDLVLVGTRNGSGANSFRALEAHTGNPRWAFVNSAGQSGDGAAIGIISGSAAIDYVNNRAYFASRVHPTGSARTLWCVVFNGTTVSRLWSVPLGDIDGSPILMNGRVYVGTNSGVVHARDAATGAAHWSYPLGDGPIKGFPFPRGTNQLFLSTNTKVWSLRDNVTSASVSPGWPVTTIPSPSIPLYVPGTTHVLVGSGDGKLYQMNVVTPLPAKSVVLGDGSAAVGVPTMDLLRMLLYVGSDAGVVYAVTFPLP